MPVKNVALTAVCYYCTDADGPVTGDDGNHNLYIVGDGSMGGVAGTPAEVSASNLPGVYKVAIAQAENNYDVVTLGGNSDTADTFISPVTWTNITNADANASTAATQSTTAATQATTAATQSTSAAGYGSGNSTKLDTVDGIVDAILVDTGTTLPATLSSGSGVSATIATNGINAASIATDAIDADAIAANAITSVEIADGSLTAAKFAADCITSAKIADDAIGADQIADDSITAAKIKDDAITAAKIEDDAITEAKIKDGAISQDKITANVAANVKQVNGSTTGVAGFLEAIGTVVSAQCHTGSSSSSIVSDTGSLSSTDDAYVRRNLTFTSGALANQTSVISDYVGSSKTFTVSVGFTGAPAENDTFIVT